MKRFYRLFTFGSFAFAIASVILFTVCEREPGKAGQIADLMAHYDELGQFNGSILVAENGKVIYKAGIGYAVQEWGIPNTPDTKFRIASITKQFTSMLVMQLVAEGKIDLEATINDYLPEYPPKNGSVITIHQLLSHTSGMPHYGAISGFFPKFSRQPYEPEEYIRLFWELDLLFKPGTKYSYSSFGYYLLGVILERVTDRSYEDLLRERIFDVAKMVDTRIDDHLSLESRRAAGHHRTFLNGYENASFRDMSTAFSTGALFSTVENLYRWDQALYTDNLLDPEHKALLFRPNIDNYGYGWGVKRLLPGEGLDSVTVVSHSGGTNGFNSRITRYLEDRHLIVLLRNSTGGPFTELQAMTEKIVQILYHQPLEWPKPSVAARMGATIKEREISAALDEYADLRERHAEDYDFSELEFNTLGYELLSRDRVNDAIEIFKLNVAAFPESANTYDSLGEAYWISGDREQALTNYRKVLELDPGNTHAAEMIKKIEADERDK